MPRSSNTRRDFMRKKPNGSSAFKQLDDDELTTMEEVPEELEQQAHVMLADGEEIKVAVSTDLKFDGNYGKDWLIATDRRLIAFNQNGTPEHQVQEISLAAVSAVEIVEMYGNNILKVRTSDKAVEVARYSRRYSPKFELATPELETLIQDANPEAEQEKKHRPQGLAKNKHKCDKVRTTAATLVRRLCQLCRKTETYLSTHQIFVSFLAHCCTCACTDDAHSIRFALTERSESGDG